MAISDHEAWLMLLKLGCAPVLHAALTTAIELNLFEIIAKSGPDAQLSPAEIASQLPTQNQQAPIILDRMLQLLTSYSIIKCKIVPEKDGNTTRFYGLTSLSKYLVPDEGGMSLAPSVLCIKDKGIIDSCYGMKDAILEGGIPFNKAHGMHLFEHLGNNKGLSELFNQSMRATSTVLMRELVEAYDGFKDLKEVVDVGGGLGATLNTLLSKYPLIRGINFDLPHVIENAPIFPGIVHVEGDMFQSIPKGETILLKNVLHDWTDDQCLKLLKNCWDALPDSGGKVIVIETMLPQFPETDVSSSYAFIKDVCMFLFTPGGRERSQKECKTLATKAGFTATKVACHLQPYGILEFYKN